MAQIQIIDPKTIRITVSIEDALKMVRDASQDVQKYASDIVTIVQKMPEFDYTYFCFYAYNSAFLFERMLNVDPKQYHSFSLDAPDAFFYVLYGGLAALYEKAQNFVMTQAADATLDKRRKEELENQEPPIEIHDAPPSSSLAEHKSLSRPSSDPTHFELDNRGLEPPQPMIRTLKKLELCHAGDSLTIHNDRVPVFLIEELNSLGYAYVIEEQSDGSARVMIRKTES